MIPQGGRVLPERTLVRTQQPSLTWKMDLERRRIVGMTDQLDAVRQSVYQILQTERFAHLIYSFNYGNELPRLIGSSPLFVRSEAERMLREALRQDDRIQELRDVNVDINGDRLIVSLVVDALYGTFEVTQEVTGSHV